MKKETKEVCIYDKMAKLHDDLMKMRDKKIDDALFSAFSSTPNKNIEGWDWKEELSKAEADGDWFMVDDIIKEAIRQTLQAQREQIFRKIDQLIADEICICNKEQTPTSRLTSLALKIDKLNQQFKMRNTQTKEYKEYHRQYNKKYYKKNRKEFLEKNKKWNRENWQKSGYKKPLNNSSK